MINKDTYSTTLANVTAVSATVTNIVSPDVISLALWSQYVTPWSLDNIWTYITIIGSTTELTNL